MGRQLTFFDDEHSDDLEAKRLARRSDPETSHAAAKRLHGKLSRRFNQAVALIAAHPDHTGRELNHLGGFDCHKRLADLERDGYIFRSGRRECECTGFEADTWRVK